MIRSNDQNPSARSFSRQNAGSRSQAAAAPTVMDQSPFRANVNPCAADCVLKRAADITITLLLVVILSPVLALCCILVFLSSGRSIFFKQVRVGKHGRAFAMWKFRTMHENSDHLLEQYLQRNPDERQLWEERIKIKNDPRVTYLGKLSRQLSLDELPQLWNILRGDMSLVGPRPITVPQMDRYGAGLQHYCCVRPGLTGLWQISGRSTTTFETRIRLDKEYVEGWTFGLDLEICFRTFYVVLVGVGAY